MVGLVSRNAFESFCKFDFSKL